MVDESLLKRICDYASLSENDVVLEVGAGKGSLTKKLVEKGCKVIAVEKNKDLFNELSGKLSDLSNLELVDGDILKVKVPKYNKVVSNIPYSISRKIVKKILLDGFDSAVLVVQKEFAEKLDADEGSINYRMITALTKSCCSIEVLENISPEAFRPIPRVWSSVVRLIQHKPLTKGYLDLLTNLFNHKNKFIRNTLSGYKGKFKDYRPVNMSPVELSELYSDLQKVQ